MVDCSADDEEQRQEARRELERARGRWPAVTALRDALRGEHLDNHFAERIRRAAGGDQR